MYIEPEISTEYLFCTEQGISVGEFSFKDNSKFKCKMDWRYRLQRTLVQIVTFYTFLEFLAENQMIEIIPKTEMPAIDLISGKVGPFRPLVKISV